MLTAETIEQGKWLPGVAKKHLEEKKTQDTAGIEAQELHALSAWM